MTQHVFIFTFSLFHLLLFFLSSFLSLSLCSTFLTQLEDISCKKKELSILILVSMTDNQEKKLVSLFPCLTFSLSLSFLSLFFSLFFLSLSFLSLFFLSLREKVSLSKESIAEASINGKGRRRLFPSLHPFLISFLFLLRKKARKKKEGRKEEKGGEKNIEKEERRKKRLRRENEEIETEENCHSQSSGWKKTIFYHSFAHRKRKKMKLSLSHLFQSHF